MPSETSCGWNQEGRYSERRLFASGLVYATAALIRSRAEAAAMSSPHRALAAHLLVRR
jgi:hypothetical protein